MRTVYICQQCGWESLKWLGRCPHCRQWNSLVETAVSGHQTTSAGVASPPQELARLSTAEADRLKMPLDEFNRVLGGGLIPGSLVLIGGEPGIGKSTLLLQLSALATPERAVVYVSGEETPRQIKLRAERLGLSGEGLYLLAETDLDAILGQIEKLKPGLVVVDSIQTVYLPELEAAPGSISQVRQCTLRLMHWAKAASVPVLISGHVTKDGAIAGPRVLEHIVDAVLYLEGEAFSAYRLLRGTKNRFGSTNEAGIFEMGPSGLSEVVDPAALYLQEMLSGDRVGSCAFPAIEGSRAVLVEVQALVERTSIVPPRRVAVGIDRTRLAQVIAVLSRHAGLRLGDHDVFVSVAGGARAVDPAADLAIALAVASAHRGVPLDGATAAYGELGLTGAVRPTGHGPRRLGAAAQGGAAVAVTPRSSRPEERSDSLRPAAVHEIPGVREALEIAFASR